ncbi:histone deacetylase [Vibrio metoecus]|uniref:histone deacetylase family protein n=1 Tax=Vibrio metoecus TaxID=1481663 RepID=UPI0006D78795|nr:histone deacetylase [Vibrio metoecus]KQB02645.1 histone deacetylase [Vibrio metoecus]PAR57720.1 histone deacetylase [Vibrio metoecus]PAR64320.1 histone deacetylase [Vibrio metoecus]
MIPLIYHPIYSQLDLPVGHRYPINKYRLLYEEIVRQQEHSEEWRTAFHFMAPQMAALSLVRSVHDSDYVRALLEGTLPAAKMRRIGFPWSEKLIERTLFSVGGTCLTVEHALHSGLAIHLSGGYHHAHVDFGSGFCLFNDLVIAAHFALSLSGVDKVLIIDSDVHHGDGTATLCAQRDDIITLSFHCDKNFPARKPASDMDIEFCKQTGDSEFISTFKQVVEIAVSVHQPDLIIYDAGVDIHHDDELGYLSISQAAIAQRDHFMLGLAKQESIPIACVIGGGYREDHAALVPLHLELLKAALSTAY